MMGLLDSFGALLPEDPQKREAAKAGLLNFGAQMLTGSRRGFAPALGMGLLGGQQAYAETQQNQQRSAMQALQMEEAQRRAAVNKGIQQAGQASLTPGDSPIFDSTGFVNRVMAIDPIQGLQLRASTSKETPFSKVDPKDYTPESVARFAQTGNFGDLMPARKMEVANGQVFNPYTIQAGTYLDNIDPNQPFALRNGQLIPNVPFQNYALSKARAGASNVSVNTKQETEEAKTVGKGLGEMYMDLQKADQSASSKIARLDRMEQLLNGVTTGKLTPAGTELAAVASSIGLSVDPQLGNKQAAEALSNEIALQMRNPSGGAGMPGALSDKDREFLVKTTPGLGKDASANKQIIETMKKLAQREKDVARIARNYRAKKGTIDEGFYAELEQFSNANPLFEAAPVKNSAPVNAGGAKFLGFE